MNDDTAAIYKTAFIATILMLVIIPLQIVVFSLNPLPPTTEAWFELFRDRPLVALFHSDFFIMVDNVLIAVIYLAFYHSFKGINKGLMQIGITLGLIGIAAYISSCKTFELMSLSGQYFSGISDQEKNAVLAAGLVMIKSWQGTAFDAYYVLNGITLIIVSFLMLKSPAYGKATAVIGLVAGFFMTIPSTAGTIGLVFSLLSLIPWYVFAVRFSIVFLREAKKG